MVQSLPWQPSLTGGLSSRPRAVVAVRAKAGH
jgi:hypothetical protein